VLFGCRVPLLVRKNQFGGNRLIGEYFVNRFMDGEAIEGLEGANFPVRRSRSFDFIIEVLVVFKYLGSYPNLNSIRFQVG